MEMQQEHFVGIMRIRNDLFSNVSLIVNNYNFRLDAGQEDFSVGVKSGVKDISCKADADYYPSNKHHIKFGMRYTYHRPRPIWSVPRMEKWILCQNLRPSMA